MLGVVLDRLGSLFDRTFILAYWAPAFIGSALAAAAASDAVGWAEAAHWWDARTAAQQGLLTIASVVAVTSAAALLQAFTHPLMELYEGFWPERHRVVRRIANALRARQRSVARHLDQEKKLRGIDQIEIRRLAWRDRYYGFPLNTTTTIQPTQLGNTLAAAEGHAFQVYRMAGPLWWPRLERLLPDAFLAQVQGASTSMVGLVNLSAMLIAGGASGGAVVWWFDHRWWMFVLAFAAPMMLSWACYRAAIVEARGYGDIVRSAFDLHRLDILKAMNIDLPPGLTEERVLWAMLNEWMYDYAPPGDTRAARTDATRESKMLPLRDGRLYYKYPPPAEQSDDGE